MEVGIKGHHEFIVEKEMLATQRGSGAAEVFASPVMIADLGVIGHGMHDRAIVNHERFIEKLNEKFKK